MFIVNPLHAYRRDNLFATHPSTENRVAALRQMAQEMGARAEPGATSVPRAGRPGRGPRGPWA